jgi:hypothetical protein
MSGHAHVRNGSWLCKNAAAIKSRRKAFLHMLLPSVRAASGAATRRYLRIKFSAACKIPSFYTARVKLRQAGMFASRPGSPP